MSHAVPSVLGADFRAEGEIISEGEVHIFGTFKGNMTAHKLMLGEGGTIEGKVKAESAVINGKLSGSLSAKSVVLGRTASVTADIIYSSMEVETGAVYDGQAKPAHDIIISPSEVVELSVMKREQIQKPRVSRGS